jgi:hypothetical protein
MQPGMQQPGMQPGMQQPGMQPGMGMPPQQQQAPQMGLGMGAGGVRVNYEGGQYSPGAMWVAVVGGQGFSNPRLIGLGLLGLSILFGVGNFVLILVTGYYFPYLYTLSAIFGPSGLWMVATGQPISQPDGSQAPMWGRIGLGVALVIGLLSASSTFLFLL